MVVQMGLSGRRPAYYSGLKVVALLTVLKSLESYKYTIISNLQKNPIFIYKYEHLNIGQILKVLAFQSYFWILVESYLGL